jgi:hypothetical protein
MALKLNNGVTDVNEPQAFDSRSDLLCDLMYPSSLARTRKSSRLTALAQTDKAQIVPRHFEMETLPYQSL